MSLIKYVFSNLSIQNKFTHWLLEGLTYSLTSSWAASIFPIISNIIYQTGCGIFCAVFCCFIRSATTYILIYIESNKLCLFSALRYRISDCEFWWEWKCKMVLFGTFWQRIHILATLYVTITKVAIFSLTALLIMWYKDFFVTVPRLQLRIILIFD